VKLLGYIRVSRIGGRERERLHQPRRATRLHRPLCHRTRGHDHGLALRRERVEVTRVQTLGQMKEAGRPG